VDQRSAEVSAQQIDADDLGFFRWGRVGGRVLLTNDAGDWAFLSEDELAELFAGKVVEGHARFEEFRGKGFLRDGLDLDAFAARIAQRNRHVRRGAYVHVVTLTHAGREGGQTTAQQGGDMSLETAETIAHFALAGLSPAMSFEFQGAAGEPLSNFAALRHFVETAQTENKRTTGKHLTFSVQTNFTAMTEEVAEWLIANEVLVCTRLDGPARVHDANRQHVGGSTHSDTIRWIEYFHRRYAELQRDPQQWHVEGRLAVTRDTLSAAREVLDEYVQRGMHSIHLHPLDASRFGDEVWAKIGYSPEEYLDFYRDTLETILELNRRGVALAEGMATIVLIKILTADDPGIVDIQSPYGAGTGQIAYDADGALYPCDEARAAGGGTTFALGNVSELAVEDLAAHPTVRAVASASLLDAQPMCADCWNKPYCGFSPVRNFISQGDLFGQRTKCFECKEHMAVSTMLFEKLAEESDADTRAILERWTVTRPAHAIDTRAVKDAF